MRRASWDPRIVVASFLDPLEPGGDRASALACLHSPDVDTADRRLPANEIDVLALITGASGFVGRHLRQHLESSGDEVVGTDRADGGPDLLDPEGLRALVGSVAPDVVYHLAGDADVGGSWNHPADTFRANAEGTLHLLEACRAAEVRRVIAISSADVYGVVTPGELPLTEQSELRPTSPYAASKVAAEYLCLQAWRGWGLGVVPVRAFNHVGPGQSPAFLAPAIASRIAEAEERGDDEITVGNVTPARDLTDVRDVVRAYRLLAVSGRPGIVYNVCSGSTLTVEEICRLLISAAKRPLRLVPDPSLQRPVDIPVLCGSHERLSTDTGWQPSIPVAQSLADLLDDCRRRRS